MGITRLRHFHGLRRTEIPDEAFQRVVAWQVLPVMVPRHGKNWTMVEFIRLIKLLIVFFNFTVEIHAISRNVEKCRVLACIGLEIKIRLHPFGNQLLRDTELDATHVTIEMKGEFLFVDYSLIIVVRNNLSEVKVEGCASRWRRKVSEVRIALRRGMNRVLALMGGPRAAEHMWMAARNHCHLRPRSISACQCLHARTGKG